jgi:hypothetical protein
MSNERSHGNALVLFAVAVIVAIVVAAVTTLKQVEIRAANYEPGTMGLAKARPPLDRAPGQPLTTGSALSASPDNRK